MRTGHGNVAFDLWLTNSASADEKSIAVEVMIWVLGNGLTPAGNRIATVKTPNGSSQFYGGKMQYWNYFAFVLDRQMHFGSVDLNAYLKYLVNENLISTNLWLASVEFGTEIAFGGGDFFARGIRSQDRMTEAPPIGAPVNVNQKESLHNSAGGFHRLGLL